MKLVKDYPGIGKNVIRLTPNKHNDMCGRSGFLIHGNSVSDPGNASRGCIVVNDAGLRRRLAAKYDRLHVVSYDVSDREMTDSNPDLPFYLGSGYRRYALGYGAPIIDQGAITRPSLPQDARVVDRFGIIASKDDFESALSIDASVSGSYGGFSGKVRASFSRQYERSQTSVTIAFTRQVVTGVFRLAQYPVEKQAKKESRNVKRFLRSYGDTLATGIGMGGACCYLFRFDFLSESEATQFKLAISAKYGTGSGSYSQEQREKMQSVRASIDFSGYTTGTLQVPDLFPPDLKKGTNFLFSEGFGDRMISGLLDYYDSFPAYFKLGEVEPGYSQCERELKSLKDVPTILRNQDEIAEVGENADRIAEALRRQKDYLQALAGQLKYVSKVRTCKLPNDTKDARKLIGDAKSVENKVDTRLKSLVDDLNLKDDYDFRDEFPLIPEHMCTADPKVFQPKTRLPRGQWRYFEFEIKPEDYGKACWIRADGHICAVGHRPNGGVLTMKLIETAVPSRSSGKRELNLPSTTDLGRSDTVIEEKRVQISRGQVKHISLGGFAFVPKDSKKVYRVAALATGDYRCGAEVTLTTHVARQTAIEMD